MALGGAVYDLGLAQGYRRGARQAKTDNENEVDRAHTLERRKADDTFTDETRDYAREQRAVTTKAQAQSTEVNAMKLEQTRQRIEDERALDFLYEVDSGVDPAQAAVRHNQFGKSKMNPDTVQYDPDSKIVSFRMDSDGDGQEEDFQYHVPKTIDAMERITGKLKKDRFKPMTDGSQMFDTQTGQVVATNPKDPTAPTPKPGRHSVYGVGMVDDAGNVITPERPRKTGGSGSNADPGLTRFNPQTYTKDVTNELGKLLGGKYDPATDQYSFAGGTKKFQLLTRIAQRHAQKMMKHHGHISAGMVAGVVAELADGFDETAIRAQAKADIEKSIGSDDKENRDAKKIFGKEFGLGEVKLSVMKQKQDEAVLAELAKLDAEVGVALEAEVLRGAYFDAGGGYADPADAADQGGGNPDDPTETAADRRPAIDWPADAPPQEKFRGVKSGKGLRNPKTGDIWYMGTDGQLHVTRAPRGGK